MRSLNARVLVAAGVVLAAFLSTAGFALDQAFHDTAMTSVRERLSGKIYMVLGIIDLDTMKTGETASAPPDPALATPDSGSYAQLLDEHGDSVWHSRSMLGISFVAPTDAKVGEFAFDRVVSSTHESLLVLSYTVLWESAGSETKLYTVQVAENEAAHLALISRFRKSLWLSFFALGAVLLLLQTAIFRWGLKPLRDVAAEVGEIERAEKHAISGEYPVELQPLTKNLNALITTNEANLKRYRNALGDLAHSLKTPLAVIRSNLEQPPSASLRAGISDSLEQLDATIHYQLQRAAAAGRNALGAPVPIAQVMERIVNSLRKVHCDRDLQIGMTVEAGAIFHGDSGDLMEIVGNIADNACKWANASVEVQVYHQPEFGHLRQRCLILEVTDDGSGMREEDVSRALLRGARLDQSTAGHGIGLAVVKELVEDIYEGILDIKSSARGTSVKMIFPGY